MFVSGLVFLVRGLGLGLLDLGLGRVWNVGFSAEVMLADVALFTVVKGLSILMLSL